MMSKLVIVVGLLLGTPSDKAARLRCSSQCDDRFIEKKNVCREQDPECSNKWLSCACIDRALEEMRECYRKCGCNPDRWGHGGVCD